MNQTQNHEPKTFSYDFKLFSAIITSKFEIEIF